MLFLFWTLFLWSNHLAASQEQENIRAEPGHDVVLPCRAGHDGEIVAVDWTRPDLGSEDVFLYRDGHFDDSQQHPSFQNRVDLQDRQMKDGDVSLILKKVMTNDTGTYKCKVSQKGTDGKVIESIFIHLKVSPPEQRIIRAELGHNVVLPCRAGHEGNITAVRWIRPDLGSEDVFLYKNGHFDDSQQHPSYQNRVDLQDRQMKDGDVSLILKNLMTDDTGTYECRVYQRETYTMLTVSFIRLEVSTPPPPPEPFPSWATALLVLLVLLVLVLIVSAGVLYHFRSYFMSVYQVEVESGAESVLLPCRTICCLPGDARVEWKVGNRKVHVYQNGSDQLEDQDQVYKDRTVMKRKLLQPGDLSLTLKLPTDEDSRIFTCIVYSREGNILMKKLVLLTVGVQQVEVESGVESVLLPFRTTDHLPGDARVEWKNGNRTVHVYQNGSDQLEDQHRVYKDRTVMKRNPLQSGDLSLTLKLPTYEDNRTFTCSVYSREGNILMKKLVRLTLRAFQVEVESGAESVLLPFRTTPDLPEDAKAKVLWWREEPKPIMNVHMYQTGFNQTGDQNQVYRTRTKMNEDPLKTGDLSLTLKHPKPGDSGKYTCKVYGHRDFMRSKTFQLQVKGRVRVQEDIRTRNGTNDPLMADESV